MLTFFKLFFRKLIYKGMYAVHSGDRVGSFFVYIKEEDRGKTNALLIMPNPMEALYVNKKDIKFDIQYKNIKFVKRLPDDVYEVCKANFVHYAKKAGIYANR